MSVYAVSDLHGRYDLFQMIKDFISPEDMVYVLGDCGDRGPNGWRIIKEVYENPQFIYIKGNHEDMFVRAMEGDELLHYCNGGTPTFIEWQKEEDMSWIHKLQDLPLEETYLNKKGQKVIVCHAGYTPHRDKFVCEEDMLWDRKHFADKWDVDYTDTFMIHGHTPVPYMDEYMLDMHCNIPLDAEISPGVSWYCEDEDGVSHKCNIDCGAYFTGHTALLNLDTFEQHIFMAEDCIYEN